MKRRVYLAIITMAVSAVAPAADQISQGRELFNGHCVVCHGKAGHLGETGKALGAADLRSEKVQSLSDAKIKQTISEGKGKMPPFADFSADELNALLSYIRTFKPKTK